MRTRIVGPLLAAGAIAAGAGCSQAANDQAHQAGDTTMQSMKKLGATIKTDATSDQTSMSVKSALVSAKGLDTSLLRVDCSGKTVTLRGQVPTPAEKHRAAAIAKGVLGPEFTFVDELSVAPRPKG